MTSSAQLTANRRNAKRSTGPRTLAGKNRVSRNALRHGLAVSAIQSPEAASSIAAMAGEILGNSSDPVERDIAIQIAAAHFEAIRARRARHSLSLDPRDPYDLDMDRFRRDKKKVMAGEASPDLEDRWFMAAIRIANAVDFTGLDLLEDTLVERAAELRRIERYERRAASRRKKAIRELDAYMQAKNSEQRAT